MQTPGMAPSRHEGVNERTRGGAEFEGGGRAPSENQVCLALHKERSPQGRRCRTKHHQPARRWLNGHVRALEHPAGCAAWVPALSAGPLLVAALLQGLRCCSGLRQCHPGHGSQQLLVGPIAQLAAHVALAAHAVCLLPLLLHPWTAGPAAWPAAHTAMPSRLLVQSRRPCLLWAVAGPAGNKWRGRHPLPLRAPGRQQRQCCQVLLVQLPVGRLRCAALLLLAAAPAAPQRMTDPLSDHQPRHMRLDLQNSEQHTRVHRTLLLMEPQGGTSRPVHASTANLRQPQLSPSSHLQHLHHSSPPPPAPTSRPLAGVLRGAAPAGGSRDASWGRDAVPA